MPSTRSSCPLSRGSLGGGFPCPTPACSPLASSGRLCIRAAGESKGVGGLPGGTAEVSVTRED
eukprot:scaffold53060_cov29-Tisochrysis_lutea.AAC.11